MIENGLLGKVAKTENPHFIGFLYPDFPFVGYLTFNKSIMGIIYTGREHLNNGEKKLVAMFHSQEHLKEIGIKFISTYSADGKYDIDLTKREVVLDLIYSKWGLDYTQYLDIETREVLLQIDEQDFLDFIKFRWFSRKRCVNSTEIGLFNSQSVCKLINKSIEEVYADVLAIDSNATLETLEISLVNCIANAKAHNYDSNKQDCYNITLKTVDENTRGREKELAIILSKFRNMEHNKKIKLMWLIAELKKQIEMEEKHDANK